MQASESVDTHQEDEGTGTPPRRPEVNDQVEKEEEDITVTRDWDPLRSPAKESFAEKESRKSDTGPDLENGNATHSIGQDIVVGDEKSDDVLRVQSPTTATAPRASHLHLELKSSQPWEADSPLDAYSQQKLENHQPDSTTQPKLTTCVGSSVY